MGQVFRQQEAQAAVQSHTVLIPDLWGKSSDQNGRVYVSYNTVLIPDLWGKSSDKSCQLLWEITQGLNPRFVGQVFRHCEFVDLFHLLKS